MYKHVSYIYVFQLMKFILITDTFMKKLLPCKLPVSVLFCANIHTIHDIL